MARHTNTNDLETAIDKIDGLSRANLVAGAVEPPDTLGEAGKRKWREMQPLVKQTVTLLDQLEIYCAAYQRWVDAQAWLTEHGDVMEIVSDKGVVLKVQPAPKLDVATRAEKAMTEAMKILRSYFR